MKHLCLLGLIALPLSCIADQQSPLEDAIASIESAIASGNAYRAQATASDFFTNYPDQTTILGNSLLNIGNRLFGEENLCLASSVFELLCTLFPQSWVVHFNAGYVLAELSRFADAAQAYTKALQINPASPDIHIQRAHALLALGDFEQGWQEYEWRWQLADKKNITFPCPAWDGSDPAGKIFLLIDEGAYGDLIQFIRYAKLLKERGAIIIAHVPENLKPLLRCAPYIDALVSKRDAAPLADYYASLMSLPYLCRAYNPANTPLIPYITVDPHDTQHWQKKVKPAGTTLAIGIGWHADLLNDAHRPMRARRSIPLSLFQPLCRLPGIKAWSLACDRNLANCSDFETIEPINDLDHAGAFLDTAALMTSLDLVITVDTSIAHLAGALGVPTWVILPAKADWRWMINRDDSPWYPTMRLFRKNDNETWESVIARIGTELEQLIAHKHMKEIS